MVVCAGVCLLARLPRISHNTKAPEARRSWLGLPDLLHLLPSCDLMLAFMHACVYAAQPQRLLGPKPASAYMLKPHPLHTLQGPHQHPQAGRQPPEPRRQNYLLSPQKPPRQNPGWQNPCRIPATQIDLSRRDMHPPGHDRAALRRVEVVGSAQDVPSDRSTRPRVLKRPRRAGSFALVEREG